MQVRKRWDHAAGTPYVPERWASSGEVTDEESVDERLAERGEQLGGGGSWLLDSRNDPANEGDDGGRIENQPVAAPRRRSLCEAEVRVPQHAETETLRRRRREPESGAASSCRPSD